MGKKLSKPRKLSRMVTQGGQLSCPYCGTTNNAKSVLALLDPLFRSQDELCAILRQVGRQMLRFEGQDDESLERMRKVLRRADNVRKALQSLDELPVELTRTAQDELAELAVDLPGLASEPGSDQPIVDVPAHKSVQRRTRLIRPRSLCIIKFPPG